MKKFLSQYKHAWVFLYFIFYLPWYFGLQLRGDSGFHDVYTMIDQATPFITWFIYPYVYWFLFVAGTIAYLFFRHKKEFYQCVAFLFIGMTICLIIFTIYPTSYNHRPDVIEGSALSTFLVNFIYTADKSQNVFPSIHVYNSLMMMISLLKSDKIKIHRILSIGIIGLAFLICLSTVMIKQHAFIDVIVAMILVIIIYVIGNRKYGY